MCNQVIRKHLGAVSVDVSAGERLQHTVTLDEGGSALFSLVDNTSGQTLLASNSPGGPPTWSVVWPADPNSAASTIHGLLVQFLVAKKYTWRVDRLAADGHVIETPLDVDYSSTPSDHCHDAINVVA